MIETLPYLTKDFPPLGGRIKTRPEDFQVEEVPLYDACGEGTHTFFCIEKTGLSTLRAVRDVARAIGVSYREIGYAGLKDTDAVTRQVFSVEHINPERVQAIEVPRVRVLWTRQHGNKLRLGHLAGNRFIIRVRGAVPGRLAAIREAFDHLAREGVPNYFGPQRFGLRGDTWEIGRAMLRQDWAEAIAVMIGRAGERDYGEVLQARRLHDRGEYEQAAKTWPYPFRDERRACWTLAKTKGNHKRAFFSVDKPLKRLYVSAFQSYLFNKVVAERIESLGRLLAGDLAYRHNHGAVFRVEDPAVEQPRADTFEISPSGPLFGYRMAEPTGDAGAIEARILAAENMRPLDFRATGAHKVKGGRRPIRFRPNEWDVAEGRDDLGEYYEFRFLLESGCYATIVLREICKAELAVCEDV
ncbi:MAG: tRNA pseudouridine(13) synthase TruD [Phycisphaerae bacterium]|nr:tRNA pseudouridine(13) synthase TruD [Phycisphaerae bacterium]